MIAAHINTFNYPIINKYILLIYGNKSCNSYAWSDWVITDVKHILTTYQEAKSASMLVNIVYWANEIEDKLI